MYLIIIAVCIVLILGFIILRSGKKKQEPAGKGHAEMAFDNPMYDDGQVAKTNPMAGAEDSGSLYDEPAMAPGDDNDAMYDEAPGNGGYVAPSPRIHSSHVLSCCTLFYFNSSRFRLRCPHRSLLGLIPLLLCEVDTCCL